MDMGGRPELAYLLETKYVRPTSLRLLSWGGPGGVAILEGVVSALTTVRYTVDVDTRLPRSIVFTRTKLQRRWSAGRLARSHRHTSTCWMAWSRSTVECPEVLR